MEDKMNAQDAIQRSISHGEIVTLDYDSDALESLKAASDDSADADLWTEFWGRDDGSEWRVHVRHWTDITIQVDDSCFGEEGASFADWCESEGYNVSRVSNVDGDHPALPVGLWERYCE